MDAEERCRAGDRVIERVDLERHRRRHGCRLVRQGARHSVWRGRSNAASTVPRHREIPRGTARSICRQLGIPEIR